MTRQIPASVRKTLEEEASPDILLAFLTIENEALVNPIRIVSDVLDYNLAGDIFLGFPFDFKLISDNDVNPETELVIQNVDREIGIAIRKSVSRAKVKMEIYSSADFDLTTNPRTEVTTATKIYGFVNFDLVSVRVNAETITGRVVTVDTSTEPWPQERATQNRCPGLFR